MARFPPVRQTASGGQPELAEFWQRPQNALRSDVRTRRKASRQRRERRDSLAVLGGTSTVRIEAIGEDFGNVDAIFVDRVEADAPSEQTLLPRDGVIENAWFDSNHEGYNGDGFVNFRRSDSTVEWEVLNDTAGEFGLTIRYALGASDRTGLLTAGKTRRKVTVESTGSWTTWETTTEQVTLPEGASTIRIEATSEDFGNVDLIELKRIS